MKTVNKNNVCDAFHNELQQIENYIEKCNTVFKEEDLFLSAFDQFAGNEILPERDFQDYQSVYLDLYQAYRPKTDGDKENINDDITFEIELIRQVEINIDYILMLVMKYHESNCKDKSILGTIDRAIDSSIQRRSKKDLIHGFISTVNTATDVDRDWQSYVQQQKQQELEQIIIKSLSCFFDRSERTLNTHARLDELLHERNMTLYQLCQSGNIPYTTLRVSRCRGSQLSVDTIEQICRVLGISMAEFFTPSNQVCTH